MNSFLSNSKLFFKVVGPVYVPFSRVLDILLLHVLTKVDINRLFSTFLWPCESLFMPSPISLSNVHMFLCVCTFFPYKKKETETEGQRPLSMLAVAKFLSYLVVYILPMVSFNTQKYLILI